MDAFVLQDTSSVSQHEANLNEASIPGKGVSDSIALFARYFGIPGKVGFVASFPNCHLSFVNEKMYLT